ncbi:MAG: SIS domain-containing protein [Bacilli bacterium]|nr:SIS domain-containing protein [Bacilli bacterium]
MKNYEKEIKEYYQGLANTFEKLDYKEISLAMNALVNCYENGGTVYVFGNGGSSSTASHMVCDFNKGVSMKKSKKFNFVCLSDNTPILTALANDVSYEDVFAYQIERILNKNDLILAISGSGNSKNIIKAIKVAKDAGVKVIGMTGYDGGQLYKMADYHLHAPINDMMKAEDIHMSFDHMMATILLHVLDDIKVNK